MKSSVIKMDQVLYGLLMDEAFKSFSVLQLREEYASRVNLNGVSLSRLRGYLYDRLKQLEKLGIVEMDDERKKRHRQFHVISKPSVIEASLQSPALGMTLKKQCEEVLSSHSTEEITSKKILEDRLKEAKLDFLAALGESESYKQIIDDMPELEGRLVADLVRARDCSSKLLGRIKALETAIEKVGHSL